MFVRYLSAAVAGTAMTFGLLFIMQLLISMQPGAVVKIRPPWFVGVVKVREETPPPPPRERFDKKKLTDVEMPPVRSRPDGTGPTLKVYVPGKPTGPSLPPIETLKNVDGPLVAMIRVQPAYPASASARELEGYAIVEFDVLENGKTANIRVIESSNRVFERPSVRAAERFKFKPRIVDGQAQVSLGIQNLFRFEMNDN